VAATNDLVALMTVVIGAFFLPETKDRRLQ